MIRLAMLWVLCALFAEIHAQDKIPAIDVNEVRRIETYLASDEMMGRKIFTPQIDKAADFIADEFRKAGLKVFPGLDGFRQNFSLVRTKFISASGNMDGESVASQKIVVVTTRENFSMNETSGFEKLRIGENENLISKARETIQKGKDQIVFVPESLGQRFLNLTRLKSSLFESDHSVVFVLTDKDPSRFEFQARHEITRQQLSNVIGILPGKSKTNEFVIFSAHYDHIGTGKPVNGDSIYNGANDDASGTTAVIALAKHYAEAGNNERSLIFVAFTAEESGGFGSQYFSRQLDPASIIAMFNIEMIGTESKWGKRSAFITGYERSNLGEIMQKNLKNSGFEFYPDPYPAQNLFYRSDNATLARLGVPAHTISTAKMEGEPHYHQVSDEVETLDLDNMSLIIQSIAVSAASIVNGTDTPSRVKLEN